MKDLLASNGREVYCENVFYVIAVRARVIFIVQSQQVHGTP